MTKISTEDLLDLLTRQAGRPLSLKELQAEFDLEAKERKAVGDLLKGLVRDGAVVRLKGGRFALPGKVNLVVGILSLHRDGYGFVKPLKGGDDVFVPARHIRPAMHGDQVVVRLERGLRSAKPEGRIIRVSERAHKTIVGRYECERGMGFLVPADRRLQEDLLISPGDEGDARPGQVVVARIDSYPGRTRNAMAVVTEVLGDADDPAVEIRVAALKADLPYEFPPDVLRVANELPRSVTANDLAGRRDLRAKPFVTIDGETARDFDDAIAIEHLDDGRFLLSVAIADVAHYVEAGGIIDREAFERGTSVYFPGSCLPMLPESLSNGICSLNPGVDRLVMVAEMVFDSHGQRLSSEFFEAVIHSHARLTYTEVRTILIDEDPDCRSQYAGLVEDLEAMAALARLRINLRHQRGSIDFDLPEAEIVLDLRGRPEQIVRSERHLGHRLVEEFMLLANEAVARFLTDQRQPVIYRVHESPSTEKMYAFQEFIAHFNQGISIPEEGVKPALLQQLLARVVGRPEEKVINHVLLRSLPQAVYATENRGHFGLALDCYCHFTSPIRRYPDLVVHRQLKQEITRRSGGKPVAALEEIASRSSFCERRAMEAERDIIDLKKCQFMESRVGDVYPGIVTSVMAFGFFVELTEYFVEGLVHVSSLDDDFYQFEEERYRLVGMSRRRIIEIGEPVTVRVDKIDRERREIDFRLIETDNVQGPRRVKRQGRRRRSR